MKIADGNKTTLICLLKSCCVLMCLQTILYLRQVLMPVNVCVLCWDATCFWSHSTEGAILRVYYYSNNSLLSFWDAVCVTFRSLPQGIEPEPPALIQVYCQSHPQRSAKPHSQYWARLRSTGNLTSKIYQYTRAPHTTPDVWLTTNGKTSTHAEQHTVF